MLNLLVSLTPHDRITCVISTSLSTVTSVTELIHQVIDALTAEFSMKDLSSLHHFLGMLVTRWDQGMFLTQCHHMPMILEHEGMPDCKPCSIPVDTCANLSANGPPVADVIHYHGLVGALQYLTFQSSWFIICCWRLSQFAFTCMNPESLTLRWSSGCYGTLKKCWISVFSLIGLSLWNSLIQMLIVLVVLLVENRLFVPVYN